MPLKKITKDNVQYTQELPKGPSDSCQIRKIAGGPCAGNVGNVSPDFKGNR